MDFFLIFLNIEIHRVQIMEIIEINKYKRDEKYDIYKIEFLFKASMVFLKIVINRKSNLQGVLSHVK